MAPVSGVGLIVPETLTEDNYEQWKRCLKNYLVGHDLWGVVSGKEPEPDKREEELHANWKRKNALASHAIQLSCGTSIYSKFDKVHVSALYAWTHLAEKALVPRLPPSSDHEDEHQVVENETKTYLKYEVLYRAIEDGDFQKTKAMIEQTPDAVRARVSSHNDTALHVAILCGYIEIADYLVGKMEGRDLAMINDYGATALSLAAICGATKLAKLMVNMNNSLLTMENEHEDGQLPVIVAALYGQKKMVHYLYNATPKSKLSLENGENGVKLLNCLITAEIYDTASMLLKKYPRLGITPDSTGHYALKILAQKPSAFPSATKFALWEKWIYYCVRIHSPWDDEKGPSPHGEDNTDNVEHRTVHIHEPTREEFDNNNMQDDENPTFRVPKIKSIHHRKLVHDESMKLLSSMFQELQTLSDMELRNMGIDSIIYDAIKHGIIEFISEMLKYKPEVIWKKDEKGRTIFAHAIVLRQESIFGLIHGLGIKKNIMARRHDAFKNNYLHLAAKLSPPSQLARVSGAALQMQRELQWFKEVESIVQPKLKDEVNENNKNPETLFTDEHKALMAEAETWMKNTAGSSMIVGTLIAAVMFTTAFTVPGGNRNDNGQPTMLETHPTPFLIFMISNALSLFTSSTSLLMFLGILTARYAEEDFLKSLPTKLIFGLTCLFLSIVTMMASFGAALYLILHEKLSWITIPIIVLSVIPIVLFSMCQFPILIEMIARTYNSRICNNPKKNVPVAMRLG
ncbi:uncharacterized protein LOC127240468 isoform X2 [Andrographis paniculata]|uniref:uncharacterized protein LOC127240468 isoform X2 n=1 Tax=Andrographis paniculata TaxID=175694 RepID=UPI0021E962F7|nr:uncharacterized protein LOC127240468 isoform X2 [Andrographis paniculata]